MAAQSADAPRRPLKAPMMEGFIVLVLANQRGDVKSAKRLLIGELRCRRREKETTVASAVVAWAVAVVTPVRQVRGGRRAGRIRRAGPAVCKNKKKTLCSVFSTYDCELVE